MIYINSSLYDESTKAQRGQEIGPVPHSTRNQISVVFIILLKLGFECPCSDADTLR